MSEVYIILNTEVLWPRMDMPPPLGFDQILVAPEIHLSPPLNLLISWLYVYC